MRSGREYRLRIRSIKNIAQVTRALQAVSASRVRRAQQAALATRPYASQAWADLRHLSSQPGRNSLHPLLMDREEVRHRLVAVISGDRGLAGAYNMNVVRHANDTFRESPVPVSYVLVGRKGRDLVSRMHVDIRAEFAGLPAEPKFSDVSAIGRLLVDEYLEGRADQVYVVYTSFVNLLRQVPSSKKLLPLEFDRLRYRRHGTFQNSVETLVSSGIEGRVYEAFAFTEKRLIVAGELSSGSRLGCGRPGTRGIPEANPGSKMGPDKPPCRLRAWESQFQDLRPEHESEGK